MTEMTKNFHKKYLMYEYVAYMTFVSLIFW